MLINTEENKLIVDVYQKRRGGGGRSHVKGMGMFVNSLRGVKYGF